MSRSTRLLALLQALRGRRQPVAASVLAYELGVHERTIYRDIASLTAEGAPIRGEGGVGYVLEAGLFLPPLMLSEDEIDAVLLGLRYVDQRGDMVLRAAAEAARAKIGAVLPPDVAATTMAPLSAAGPHDGHFPDTLVSLDLLRTAIREQKRLAIQYVDEEKAPSERVIWPIQLGFMENARVVTAWCELRQAFRFFRTDRILSATLGERYPKRRAMQLRDFQRGIETHPG